VVKKKKMDNKKSFRKAFTKLLRKVLSKNAPQENTSRRGIGIFIVAIMVISVFGAMSVIVSAEQKQAPLLVSAEEGRDVMGTHKAMPEAQANGGLVTADLDTGLTPTDLVNTLIGEGVTVSNVAYSGANVAAGTFSGGTGIIGFESGIILSTGNIASVVGPNTADDTTTNNGMPGDADLDSLIPGYATFDAAVLEFDFVPTSDVVTFEYVFGSEEYNEFVNSPYNNVFGFFINGVNCALIPGTSTPVSINNVNGGNPYGTDASNPEYYRNNDPNDPGPPTINTELDGLTVVLSVTANVNAGETNHIKLAIADAGDYVLDSDVFIKEASFRTLPAAVPTLMPIGLIALIGLLSVVAAMSISIKKKRR